MTMNAVKRIGRGLAVLAIGFSILGAAACSRDPDVAKREFLANGDKYVEQKKYNEAIIEYRNALLLDPLLPEAHRKLAQAYEEIADSANAARMYVRAADLLPDDPDIQVRAGVYLLAAESYEEARVRAQKALSKSPRHVEAQVLLAESLAHLKGIDAAVKQVEESIRMQPDASDPYAKLGRFELAQGKLKEAEAAFQRAVALDPKSSYAISGLANFYLATGKMKEAEEWLLKAVEVAPSDTVANRLLAAFYLQTNRVAEAEKPLKTVVASSSAPAARLILADYYYRVGRKGETRQILEGLNDELTFADTRMRLSVLEWNEGHRDKAHAALDAVLAKFAKHAEASVLKGRYLLAEQQDAKAFELFKTAVESDPGSAEAHFRLGMMHRRMGDPAAARAEFGEVNKLMPGEVGSKLQLAQMDLIDGKADSALAQASEAVRLQRNNPMAHLVLIDALIATNRLPEALKEANLMATTFQKAPEPQLQLGLIYQKQRDYPAAERALTRAIELSKGERKAVWALIDVRLASGRVAAARELAESHVAQQPKNPWFRIYASRVYRAERANDKAEAALKEAARLDPANLQAYLELSRLYIDGQKLDDARAQLEAIVAKSPNEVWAHTLIAMSLHLQNRTAEARQRYEKILAIDPRAAIAANNLATMMVDQGENLDKALDLAQTAKQQLPESPEVSDTLGSVYLRKGLWNMALPAFEFSVRGEPGNPIYQYHLGMTYEKMGDKARARTALQRALTLQPDFEGSADARRLLSTL